MFMHDEPMDSLEKLEQRVKDFVPTRDHDACVVVSIEEAIAAAKAGNTGVGAVIVDPDGQIAQRGYSQPFHPYFRSDRHAEMDAMTKFEDRFKEVTSMRNYTLFTSLEPCPMCLTRLIWTGIGKVFHAAPDVDGGMVHKLKDMPPVWLELAATQEFAQADCSEELTDIAFQVFLVHANTGLQKLMERRA
jgi:cytosine deaminase